MKASKWIQLRVLLSHEELANLFTALEPFELHATGSVLKKGESLISVNTFLEKYHSYTESLKEGSLPNLQPLRPYFSSILTIDDTHLEKISINEEQELVRMAHPAVQLQHHTLAYSAEEKKFRSMVLGKNSIYWGLQFSYPQLYLDAEQNIHHILKESSFPNTVLFSTIQKWFRRNTIPTPFIINEGERINVPARIGKECLSWVNYHPQLKEQHLRVDAN